MFTEFLLYFQDQLIQNGWFCQFDDSFHNTGGLSGQIVEMTLIVWLDQCLFICIFSSKVCLFVYFNNLLKSEFLIKYWKKEIDLLTFWNLLF